MESDQRWTDLAKLLNRPGPFAPAAFDENREIGAGGLGCEILKNLALSGVKQIHVIDMDTIDLSNLNRQFLFRNGDIGKPKATVAADFVMKRVAGVTVTAHYCKIQDFPDTFYRQFGLIICGLDSIEARRWINATVFQLYDPNDPSTMIPIVDGGTEGFKGQARVILPGQSSCYECSLDMLTKKVNFPLCTIANTPRLPEHCIEYASVLKWPKQFPGKKLDGDDPEHIKWLYDTATKRAQEFNIRGVTYSLTQGVVKNIIPAIASTNAIIAAACCNEALKMITSCAKLINNYVMYTGDDGIYTYTFEHQKKPDCPVCGNQAIAVELPLKSTVQDLLDLLADKPTLMLKKPSLRTQNKSIYMRAPPQLEELTRPNLEKKLTEFAPDQTAPPEFQVTDPTVPFAIKIQISFVDDAAAAQ